jgi:hypothetical protein
MARALALAAENNYDALRNRALEDYHLAFNRYTQALTALSLYASLPD